MHFFERSASILTYISLKFAPKRLSLSRYHTVKIYTCNMSIMASQITSNSTISSTSCSDWQQIKAGKLRMLVPSRKESTGERGYSTLKVAKGEGFFLWHDVIMVYSGDKHKNDRGRFNTKCRPTNIGYSIGKIILYYNRPISRMRYAILIRQHLCNESGPTLPTDVVTQ